MQYDDEQGNPREMHQASCSLLYILHQLEFGNDNKTFSLVENF